MGGLAFSFMQREEKRVQDEAATVVKRGFELRSRSLQTYVVYGSPLEGCGLVLHRRTGAPGEWCIHRRRFRRRNVPSGAEFWPGGCQHQNTALTSSVSLLSNMSAWVGNTDLRFPHINTWQKFDRNRTKKS